MDRHAPLAIALEFGARVRNCAGTKIELYEITRILYSLEEKAVDCQLTYSSKDRYENFALGCASHFIIEDVDVGSAGMILSGVRH